MTYASTVSADNPLHFWRLADPGGFLAHDIGSSPLALSATKYLASLPYTGPAKDGGSAFFTAQALYTFADAATQAYPISIEAWFWQAQRAARLQEVFSLEQTGGAQALSVHVQASGIPALSSGGSLLVATAAVSLQHWHHLVAVHTGAARRLYVDGALVANDAQARVNDAIGFTVGARYSDFANWCEGNIAEVAMYNYTLIAAQISAHFNAADNTTQRPIFRGLGTIPTSSGGTTTVPELASTIAGYVSQTYQNSV